MTITIQQKNMQGNQLKLNKMKTFIEPTLIGKDMDHINDINKAHNYYTLHQMADGTLYLQGWNSKNYYETHKEDDNCILSGKIYDAE